MYSFLQQIRRRRFFKYGLPFMIMVVGGSFGLKEFTSLKYDFQRSKFLSREEVEKTGKKLKETKVTLESEYEKIKELDIGNWENIRGPRVWEDSDSMKKIRERSEQAKLKRKKQVAAVS